MLSLNVDPCSPLLGSAHLPPPPTSAVCGRPGGLYPANIREDLGDPLAQGPPGSRCVPLTAVPGLPAGGGDPEPRAERQVPL